MDDLAKISDLLNELQATADRQKELLKRVLALIDDTDLIIPPHLEDVAYNLYKDIEKELSDGC